MAAQCKETNVAIRMVCARDGMLHPSGTNPCWQFTLPEVAGGGVKDSHLVPPLEVCQISERQQNRCRKPDPAPLKK